MKSIKEIERPYDLAPRGIKSTIKSSVSFNETFCHIYHELKKIKKDE